MTDSFDLFILFDFCCFVVVPSGLVAVSDDGSNAAWILANTRTVPSDGALPKVTLSGRGYVPDDVLTGSQGIKAASNLYNNNITYEKIE